MSHIENDFEKGIAGGSLDALNRMTRLGMPDSYRVS